MWMPHVGRDTLNAMVNVPRYSIRKVNQIARDIEKACEKTGDELSLIMAKESISRCLLQQGKLTEAIFIFREENERITRLSHAGALHRVLIMKSEAHLSWVQNDLKLWHDQILEALHLMIQAGLTHQLRSIKKVYGEKLKPVLDAIPSPKIG